MSLSPPTLGWSALQNGSDLRGVALEGIPGEAVNLTPAVATTLGHACVSWLSDQLHTPAPELTIAIG
ncbi:MAG: phosphomannomutase/phosphoglucomutase, partial [Nodosilinea sp.]